MENGELVHPPGKLTLPYAPPTPDVTAIGLLVRLRYFNAHQQVTPPYPSRLYTSN